jgi:hypothetical protein
MEIATCVMSANAIFSISLSIGISALEWSGKHLQYQQANGDWQFFCVYPSSDNRVPNSQHTIESEANTVPK